MLRLCPPDVGDIGVKFWSRNGDLAASVILDCPVGRPENKLLAAVWNRDADEISEQHPPVRAVVLADDAKRVFVGRESDLLVAVLVDYSKSVG